MKDNYQNDEFLQKRRKRQKEIRKRRARTVCVLLLILLLITGAVLSVTVLFPIKTINASGSKIYTPAEIIDASDIKIGENLIIVSEKEVLKSLKSKLPYIEAVEIERSLPDTLKLKVSDAKEYACYKYGNKFFTVSKSGWVLNSYEKQPKNITLIISDKVKCKIGSQCEFLDDSLLELCKEITANLKKYNLTVEYVDITDKMAIEAKVSGRFIVNFGSSKDFEPKVKHLVAMMEKIGKNDKGKINLSMWDSKNTQGTFVKSEIK